MSNIDHNSYPNSETNSTSDAFFNYENISPQVGEMIFNENNINSESPFRIPKTPKNSDKTVPIISSPFSINRITDSTSTKPIITHENPSLSRSLEIMRRIRGFNTTNHDNPTIGGNKQVEKTTFHLHAIGASDDPAERSTRDIQQIGEDERNNRKKQKTSLNPNFNSQGLFDSLSSHSSLGGSINTSLNGSFLGSMGNISINPSLAPSLNPSLVNSNGYSNSVDSQFVVSIAEFRNKRFFGVAAIDLLNPEIKLSQFSDNDTLGNTMMLLNYYDPITILIADTSVDSALHNILKSEYPHSQILAIRRKYFNETMGIEYIHRYCTDLSIMATGLDNDKYLCLAASGCLLKYLDYQQHLIFHSQSLNLNYSNLEGFMLLDIRTVQSLELVKNINSFSTGYLQHNTNTINNHKYSLFDMINHTKTKSGARLLRMNLLQPLTDIATIKLRHDAVEYLLNNETVYRGLKHILPKFHNLTGVCGDISRVSKQDTLHTVQSQLHALVCLRQILEHVETLSLTCQGKVRGNIAPVNSMVVGGNNTNTNINNNNPNIEMEVNNAMDSQIEVHNLNPHSHIQSQVNSNALFMTYVETMDIETCQHIIDLLDLRINSDTATLNKTGAEVVRMKIASSVKINICGLLDTHRDAFIDAIDNISSHAEDIFEAHNVNDGKLLYTSGRGYHLSLSTHSLDWEHSDNRVFIKRVVKGSRVLCTTEILESLNMCQNDNFDEVCRLSMVQLTELLNIIRGKMSWLHSLNESIGMIDMTSSLAQHVIVNQHYTKPNISDVGMIDIKQGRHPMLTIVVEKSGISDNIGTRAQEYIPNDLYLHHNMHNTAILYGANNSGKTTLMKMVGLLCIMSQIGAYVPAESMIAEPVHEIYTCMGETKQNINDSSSTFYTEMKYIANIMHSINSISTDELGNPMSDSLTVENSSKLNSKRKLILIDELGKSTSSLEGLSLYWSVLEYIGTGKNYCLGTTHYTELAQMQSLYSHIQNIQLRVDIDIPNYINPDIVHLTNQNDNQHTYNNSNSHSHNNSSSISQGLPSTTPSICFTYSATPMRTHNNYIPYGIALAHCIGFPMPLLSAAKQMATIINNTKNQEMQSNNNRNFLMYVLLSNLFRLPHYDSSQHLLLFQNIIHNFTKDMIQLQQNNNGGINNNNNTSNNNNNNTNNNTNNNYQRLIKEDEN